MKIPFTYYIDASALAVVFDAPSWAELPPWGGVAEHVDEPKMMRRGAEGPAGVTATSADHVFEAPQSKTSAICGSFRAPGSVTGGEAAVTAGLYCQGDADSAPAGAGSAILGGYIHD